MARNRKGGNFLGIGERATPPEERYHKDPDVFRKWLEAKPGDEIVGIAKELYLCPLMKWANEVAPLPDATRGFNPNATGRHDPSEEWARIFGQRTDALGENHEVTAAEALKILHEVMAERASIG